MIIKTGKIYCYSEDKELMTACFLVLSPTVSPKETITWLHIMYRDCTFANRSRWVLNNDLKKGFLVEVSE